MFPNQVNGKPHTHNFRRLAAYCTQEDVLIPDLTVFETLHYASLLLLPSTMSSRERSRRVEEVLKCLRLEKVRDSPIGGGFQRGISGGEKRRVSIGLELLTKPSLLLGDEVTSGLDSFSALSVMNIMKELAVQGHTVRPTPLTSNNPLYSMSFAALLLVIFCPHLFQSTIERVLTIFSRQCYVCSLVSVMLCSLVLVDCHEYPPAVLHYLLHVRQTHLAFGGPSGVRGTCSSCARFLRTCRCSLPPWMGDCGLLARDGVAVLHASRLRAAHIARPDTFLKLDSSLGVVG